ncbi:hypothetical protein Rhe02_54550 [Rhizocola hellebori]|uniref:HTH cro/C1-type domain-containing protein n=2 Tax=Rhizocola hellebori TaxID=1392758 RepID=A0A8J3QCW4_9ACTN|nr:hypothetical protein Rhe02_54550 [Rhizocola hellebori]
MLAALVALRKGRRQSQAELGGDLSVTQTCISYWESGKRAMTTADLADYARAFGKRWILVDAAAGVQLSPPRLDPPRRPEVCPICACSVTGGDMGCGDAEGLTAVLLPCGCEMPLRVALSSATPPDRLVIPSGRRTT